MVWGVQLRRVGRLCSYTRIDVCLGVSHGMIHVFCGLWTTQLLKVLLNLLITSGDVLVVHRYKFLSAIFHVDTQVCVNRDFFWKFAYTGFFTLMNTVLFFYDMYLGLRSPSSKNSDYVKSFLFFKFYSLIFLNLPFLASIVRLWIFAWNFLCYLLIIL